MQYATAAAARGDHAAVFALDESRAILLARTRGLGAPLTEGDGPGQVLIRQIDSARHALRFQVPDAPIWVFGDAARLAQVAANLISNAAKYTPERGLIAYFSPSWTAFQAERGRDFSVIVDGVSD